MIDTHCHILPGIDDGALDLKQCHNMCMMAIQDGTSVICATPHFNGQWPLVNHDLVNRLSRELNAALRFDRIPLKIVPGMEIRVSADLERDLDNNKLKCLGDSKTLLLEFHPAGPPVGFEKLAEVLITKGYHILLAHPEKNSEIQEHPEYLFHLLKKFEPWKISTQVTASSISGDWGRKEKRISRILLEHNLAHVIASDAHDDRSRTPILSAGVNAAENIVGSFRANQMVKQIPRALIENTSSFPDWPVPTNPRKWWRIF